MKDELEEFKWDKQAEETAGGYGWSGGCKVGRLREAGPGRGARGHGAEEVVSIPKAED